MVFDRILIGFGAAFSVAVAMHYDLADGLLARQDPIEVAATAPTPASFRVDRAPVQNDLRGEDMRLRIGGHDLRMRATFRVDALVLARQQYT